MRRKKTVAISIYVFIYHRYQSYLLSLSKFLVFKIFFWKLFIYLFLAMLGLWLSWERICLQCGRPGFNPWVGKIPWRRERLPTPVSWPGEFHGLSQRVRHDWATFTSLPFTSCWVLDAMCGLSRAVVGRGYSLIVECRLLIAAASLIVEPRL